MCTGITQEPTTKFPRWLDCRIRIDQDLFVLHTQINSLQLLDQNVVQENWEMYRAWNLVHRLSYVTTACLQNVVGRNTHVSQWQSMDYEQNAMVLQNTPNSWTKFLALFGGWLSARNLCRHAIHGIWMCSRCSADNAKSARNLVNLVGVF